MKIDKQIKQWAQMINESDHSWFGPEDVQDAIDWDDPGIRDAYSDDSSDAYSDDSSGDASNKSPYRVFINKRKKDDPDMVYPKGNEHFDDIKSAVKFTEDECNKPSHSFHISGVLVCTQKKRHHKVQYYYSSKDKRWWRISDDPDDDNVLVRSPIEDINQMVNESECMDESEYDDKERRKRSKYFRKNLHKPNLPNESIDEKKEGKLYSWTDEGIAMVYTEEDGGYWILMDGEPFTGDDDSFFDNVMEADAAFRRAVEIYRRRNH